MTSHGEGHMTAHACFWLEVQIACGMRTLVDAGSIGPCYTAQLGTWRVGKTRANAERVQRRRECATMMRRGPWGEVLASRDNIVLTITCSRDHFKSIWAQFTHAVGIGQIASYLSLYPIRVSCS